MNGKILNQPIISNHQLSINCHMSKSEKYTPTNHQLTLGRPSAQRGVHRFLSPFGCRLRCQSGGARRYHRGFDSGDWLMRNHGCFQFRLLTNKVVKVRPHFVICYPNKRILGLPFYRCFFVLKVSPTFDCIIMMM